MTVEELIDELLKLPAHMPVVVRRRMEQTACYACSSPCDMREHRFEVVEPRFDGHSVNLLHEWWPE
jgi:hypothetical protein